MISSLSLKCIIGGSTTGDSKLPVRIFPESVSLQNDTGVFNDAVFLRYFFNGVHLTVLNAIMPILFSIRPAFVVAA